MANWAANQIYFTGEESKVKEVTSLFVSMAAEGSKTNEGQKPFFIPKVKQDYFFDIYVNEIDNQISYSTKWKSNEEDCILIANHYNLNFECTYQELGSNIYGKSIFTAGNTEAKNYNLSSDYFKMYQYDESEDIYKYEGENYECEDDILEILFEKEFNITY